TTVPQQQLFVLNSDFMINNAKALAAQLAAVADTDGGSIHAAFARLSCREQSVREMQLGLAYLQNTFAADQNATHSAVESEKPNPAEEKLSRWQRYAQVLLGDNEFMYVD